jgi:hypothetical protein
MRPENQNSLNSARTDFVNGLIDGGDGGFVEGALPYDQALGPAAVLPDSGQTLPFIRNTTGADQQSHCR